MLPASVARFRIWTDPTTAAASARAGEVAPDPLVDGDVGHHRRAPRYQTLPVGLADLAIELGDPLDVDDEARPDRAVAESDDQVGPAGEQPRRRGRAREQRERPVEAGRSLVREGAHRRPRAPGPPRPGGPGGWPPGRRSRAARRTADEVGPGPAQRIGVDHRHREAGRKQLVQEEVVLDRMEGLELPLERDHLDHDGSKLPSIAGTTTTSTLLGSVWTCQLGMRAEELLDARGPATPCRRARCPRCAS